MPFFKRTPKARDIIFALLGALGIRGITGIVISGKPETIIVEPGIVDPKVSAPVIPIPGPIVIEPVTATVTPEVSSTCTGGEVCNPDMIKYCPGIIESQGKSALVSCLYTDHFNDISDACKESLECHQRLNESVMVSCATDKQKYCATIEPAKGSEPLVTCLWGNESSLSSECLSALQAHKAGKVTR